MAGSPSGTFVSGGILFRRAAWGKLRAIAGSGIVAGFIIGSPEAIGSKSDSAEAMADAGIFS